MAKAKPLGTGISEEVYRAVLRDMDTAKSQIGKPKLAIKILKSTPARVVRIRAGGQLASSKGGGRTRSTPAVTPRTSKS